jgi:signal peptidase II
VNPSAEQPAASDVGGADWDADGATVDGRGTNRRLLAVVAAVCGLVWVLDLVTKTLAVARLDPARPVAVVPGWLQWHLTRNPYAAFNLSPGRTWIITLVATVVVVVVARAARRVTHPAWAVAMGLLLGGALGNLTDRYLRAPGFARGHVVDFIQYLRFPFIDFPIFNVADSCIVVSAVLIGLLALRNIPFDAGDR